MTVPSDATLYLALVLRVVCSAVMVRQVVMFPSLLKVANHGRGCFLYKRKIFGFSFTTAWSHSLYSWGVLELCEVARIAIASRHKNGHSRKPKTLREIAGNPHEYKGILVSAAGFEPATHALKGHCSTT